MAKPGNHNNKERCKRYAASGNREKNKKLKQARHKKRTEKFAERKRRIESGELIVNHKKYYNHSNSPKDTPYAKLTSLFRKLDNWIEEQERLHKLEKEKNDEEESEFENL